MASPVIDQISKPYINEYLCEKYNLIYKNLLEYVSNYFEKQIKTILLHCNTITITKIVQITKIN